MDLAQNLCDGTRRAVETIAFCESLYKAVELQVTELL